MARTPYLLFQVVFLFSFLYQWTSKGPGREAQDGPKANCQHILCAIKLCELSGARKLSPDVYQFLRRQKL